MKKAIVVVAGGSGTRMGHNIPKQFILLKGKPILMHTIESLHQYNSDAEIILVLPKNQKERWEKLCFEYTFNIKTKLAYGGETRFQSVKNGLEKITDADIIGIHDGVRPLVSIDTLIRCFDTAYKYGNAIPVIDAIESIREIKNDKNLAVDRHLYKMVQTPQVFRYDIITKSYNQEFSNKFTDDASVVESNGYSIYLVEGNRENIKITTPMDLKIAEALIS